MSVFSNEKSQFGMLELVLSDEWTNEPSAYDPSMKSTRNVSVSRARKKKPGFGG